MAIQLELEIKEAEKAKVEDNVKDDPLPEEPQV